MVGNGGGNSATVNTVTPLTAKGGVVRVIDSATGDIARTTSGWIEDEKYGWYALNTATAWSAEFDSAVTRTGARTVKLSTTDTTGRAEIWTSAGGAVSTAHGIPLKPNTLYALRCYIKTNNSVAVKVGLGEFSSALSAIITGFSTTLVGTNDWTLKEFLVTTNASTAYGTIKLSNATAGNISDAWFDVNSMTLEQVSSITNPSATPALLYPKATAVTSKDNVDQSLDSAGAYANTYAIPTAINEGATHRQTFTPTKKHNTGITIWPVTKGTGDWTLTVHDSSNNVIGTPRTIANASVTTGALLSFLNSFDWTSGTYHFHVTSTVNDGTLKTNTSNDLEACSFTTLYEKHTTNLTVSTDTQQLSVTAPTTDGWADGTVIDTATIAGITPLTLAPGVNNIYVSSNGPATADGTVDPSLQMTFSGTFVTS